MSQKEAEFRQRLVGAQARLVEQFLHHPDVQLIDAGYAPEGKGATEEIVLRVHVRKQWMESDPAERVSFPKEVAGILVVVMLGDYRLAAGESPSGTDQATGK